MLELEHAVQWLVCVLDRMLVLVLVLVRDLVLNKDQEQCVAGEEGSGASAA